MKKLKILLTAILFLTLYFGEAQHLKPYGHINVTEKAQKLFHRFITLMEENEIEVDYTKIKYITILPLQDGISGYWLEQSGTVILNHYMYVPEEATKEEILDLVYITLAHEIGHSQGWQHTDQDAINLMNPTSKFDFSIIRGSIGADQYILNTYKNKLCPCGKHSSSE